MGLFGFVWKERVPLWSPDVQDDVRFPPSELMAPGGSDAPSSFRSKARRVHRHHGVLLPGAPGRDDALLQLAATLGSQIGQFIERKRAEEDLRFQKSLLESQSEAAIDGILVVSRNGEMTSFNRRFCQMWDIPRR
jgi:PAS domain-containing protein